MDPDPSLVFDISGLFVVAFFIFCNAVFVAAEYALISCDPGQIKNRRSESSSTSHVLWLIDNSELCVASIQLVITTCSILVGWFGIKHIGPILEQYSQFLFSDYVFSFLNAHYVAYAFALLILVVVHVILGELVIKAVATSFPESTLAILALPVRIVTQLSYPISRCTYSIGNFILKPFRIKVGQTDKDLLSIKELKRLFSSVPSSSDIGTEQAMMIRGIVGFSETVAREVMTPRVDLTTISVNATLEEAVRIILDSGFSRLPVRGDKLDDILGILLSRDVIPFAYNLASGGKPFDVRRIMRQAYFIPAMKPIDDLLSEFKRRKIHMAIILDEHGGLDGVVTLEDIIEEIVGDIFDEGDELEKDVVKNDNGDLLVNSGILVADLNDLYNLKIPEGEYDTLGGFILTCLGRIPVSGDSITVDYEDFSHVFVNGVIVPLRSEITDTYPKESDSLVEEGVVITIENVQGHRIEKVILQIKTKVEGQFTESDTLDLSSNN